MKSSSLPFLAISDEEKSLLTFRPDAWRQVGQVDRPDAHHLLIKVLFFNQEFSLHVREGLLSTLGLLVLQDEF